MKTIDVVAVSQKIETTRKIDEISKALEWNRSEFYRSAVNHYLTCPSGLAKVMRLLDSLGPNSPSHELAQAQAHKGKIRRET